MAEDEILYFSDRLLIRRMTEEITNCESVMEGSNMSKREITVVLTPEQARRLAKARVRAEAEAKKEAEARAQKRAIAKARATKLLELKAPPVVPKSRQKGGVLGPTASPTGVGSGRTSDKGLKLTAEAEWIKQFGFD